VVGFSASEETNRLMPFQRSLQLPSLTRLFEKMDEGMMVVDAEWHILYANDFARRYLGLAQTDERLRAELIPQMAGRLTLRTDGHMRPAGEVEERSIAFEASSLPGSSLPFTLSVYMSRPNEDGMRFVLLRDVTRERNEELWKGRFLSLVSHKLATPINVVKMAMSNMADGVTGTLTVRQREMVDTCMKKLAILETSIRRLLEYVKLHTMVREEQAQELDVVPETEAYCKRFAKVERLKKVDVRIQLGAESALIGVHEKHFIAALDSIFENAVKFHPGPVVHIFVSFRRDGITKEFEIAIRDDGPGIPAPIQRDVFSEFIQRDDELTGNVQGMGLGLPFVKGIMGLFGGRIALDSRSGQGTTVRLLFPILRKD
jgi:signal transduction histidine kinase